MLTYARMMNFTIQRDSEQFGPYTLDQLRSMAQAGQLLATDLVISPQNPTPVPLGSFLQFTQGDTTGGMIPYKNGQALAGYYVAVASLIPCLGLVCGPVAFFLGLSGLKKVKQQPWVRGTAHAWVAIILGGLTGLANVAMIAVPFVMSYLERR